jgi:hypothetical protein
MKQIQTYRGRLNTSSCTVGTKDNCFSSKLWCTVALIQTFYCIHKKCQDLDVMFDIQCKEHGVVIFSYICYIHNNNNNNNNLTVWIC